MDNQGRGSAGLLGVVQVVAVLLCLMAVQLEYVDAATFTVGDSGGWSYNTDKWPNGKQFRAGDVLIFNYDYASQCGSCGEGWLQQLHSSKRCQDAYIGEGSGEASQRTELLHLQRSRPLPVQDEACHHCSLASVQFMYPS